jgi:hypothetical protein
LRLVGAGQQFACSSDLVEPRKHTPSLAPCKTVGTDSADRVVERCGRNQLDGRRIIELPLAVGIVCPDLEVLPPHGHGAYRIRYGGFALSFRDPILNA